MIESTLKGILVVAVFALLGSDAYSIAIFTGFSPITKMLIISVVCLIGVFIAAYQWRVMNRVIAAWRTAGLNYRQRSRAHFEWVMALTALTIMINLSPYGVIMSGILSQQMNAAWVGSDVDPQTMRLLEDFLSAAIVLIIHGAVLFMAFEMAWTRFKTRCTLPA